MTAPLQRGVWLEQSEPGERVGEGGHRGEGCFRRASQAILRTVALILSETVYSHIWQFSSHTCFSYHVTVTFQKIFLYNCIIFKFYKLAYSLLESYTL